MLAGIWRVVATESAATATFPLFETALHELMYIGPGPRRTGTCRRGRQLAHPTIVPFQNFEASDGCSSSVRRSRFLERTCTVIGLPGLNDDERFATMAARNEHRDELVPLLEEAFRSRT